MWAIQGGPPDEDRQFIANLEGNLNGGFAVGGNSDELTRYSLFDGRTSLIGITAEAISGELTSADSGSFSTTINLGALGIPGVATAGDIDYFHIAFAQNEDGSGAPTAVHELSLSSSVIPEPSALYLLVLGGALLVNKRRKLARR